MLAWAWGPAHERLAHERLLQIVDSTHPKPRHATLCDQLRGFIAQAASEVSVFAG